MLGDIRVWKASRVNEERMLASIVAAKASAKLAPWLRLNKKFLHRVATVTSNISFADDPEECLAEQMLSMEVPQRRSLVLLMAHCTTLTLATYVASTDEGENDVV